MLQGMENDGSMKQGSVTAIAKRFSMACCTVHCLWKRAAHMHATAIINSPEFYSCNRNMSKSKGWTLQSSLLTLWMEKTRVNNQTKIDDDVNLLKTL